MIIESLLDQDFYKFTMAQVVLHQFPDFQAKYRFKCRNQGIHWTPAMVREIQQELEHYCSLRLTESELAFLHGIRFLKPYFVDFLGLYKPDPKYLRVSGGEGFLEIEVEGPWFLTIHFEMPILSIVNEVYFRHVADFASIRAQGEARLEEKIGIAQREGIVFSEFGTRRRHSRAWQEWVVARLEESLPRSVYTGSSNVLLSMRHGSLPIGTMAHEYVQAGQASDATPLANSQRFMFQKWVDEYRGDLGIALSDTLGFEKFLKDFDLYFAKLYDGARHDSGDPIAWGRRMIEHYKALRIDPRTKTLVFSDGLDFPTAVRIAREFEGQVKVSFGIGTNLTNDFPGVEPLQIVLKMVECNGKPVAKLSDNPAKTMCENESFLTYLRSVI
jgi:nicotinate phosphoribosyltransferase